MALKFLNKKGWHTGSLRNIENVWKAEQKHGAEQKKLDELRKQIQEERERAEFRQLQERAGLVPRQERLDFLYESGLGVGKGSSEGFKALHAPPTTESPAAAASSGTGASSSKAAVPGALFEDKPQSANDTWRKLHSDPLLLIRQREQDALARIKNNPVQMAMIRKSIEAEKKHKEKGLVKEKREKKEHKRKHHHNKSKHSSEANQDSKDSSQEMLGKRRDNPTYGGHGEHNSRHNKQAAKAHSDSEEASKEMEERRKTETSKREVNKEMERRRKRDYATPEQCDTENANKEMDGRRKRENIKKEKVSKETEGRRKRDSSTFERHIHHRSRQGEDPPNTHFHSDNMIHGTERKHVLPLSENNNSSSRAGSESKYIEAHASTYQQHAGYHHRRAASKLTEEERAAKLREMQQNAELHEEQRWKRLKKASEVDAQEANKDKPSLGGRNFLDAAHKSIYGAEKGGSSTIEESVRRRTYYLQGGAAASESNAFRR